MPEVGMVKLKLLKLPLEELVAVVVVSVFSQVIVMVELAAKPLPFSVTTDPVEATNDDEVSVGVIKKLCIADVVGTALLSLALIV